MVLAFARVSCLLHLAEKPDATEAWLLLGGKKKKARALVLCMVFVIYHP